jgi:predicted nuclease of predicted toxin-antitoxin system
MVYSAETNQGIAKSIKNVLVEDRIQLIQSSVLKDETKNIKKDTEIFDSIKYTNPMVIPTDGDMMRVTSSRRTSL